MSTTISSPFNSSSILAGALAVAGCNASADATPMPPPAAEHVTTASSPSQASPPPTVHLDAPVKGVAPPNPYTTAQIERGKFLVQFGSCNDCHTPWAYDDGLGAPVPDMRRMLSGHPEGAPGPSARPGPGDIAVIGPTFTSFAMPFGIVHTPNLTPDIDTGTGSWTEEMFLNIFRKAKHLGGDGRPVLPPMPWPMVASLPDQDIVAIFAYLRSIPPIRNAAPVAEPSAEVERRVSHTNESLLQLFAK